MAHSGNAIHLIGLRGPMRIWNAEFNTSVIILFEKGSLKIATNIHGCGDPGGRRAEARRYTLCVFYVVGVGESGERRYATLTGSSCSGSNSSASMPSPETGSSFFGFRRSWSMYT